MVLSSPSLVLLLAQHVSALRCDFFACNMSPFVRYCLLVRNF